VFLIGHKRLIINPKLVYQSKCWKGELKFLYKKFAPGKKVLNLDCFS